MATSLREIQSQESSQWGGGSGNPARLPPSPASRNLSSSRLSEDGSTASGTYPPPPNVQLWIGVVEWN